MKLLKTNDLPLQPGTADLVFRCVNCLVAHSLWLPSRKFEIYMHLFPLHVLSYHEINLNRIFAGFVMIQISGIY